MLYVCLHNVQYYLMSREIHRLCTLIRSCKCYKRHVLAAILQCVWHANKNVRILYHLILLLCAKKIRLSCGSLHVMYGMLSQETCI